MSASRLLVQLSRAAMKAAGAKVRGRGFGAVAADWPERAEACARCPLVVVQCGRSYCGKPFLQRLDRDEAVHGCGCPTLAKAKDPAEHCPITPRHRAATKAGGMCDCKWCALQTAEASAELTLAA